MQPNLVIVYFGGNDSVGSHESGRGPHVPLEEYVENMRKIINHIKVQLKYMFIQAYYLDLDKVLMVGWLNSMCYQNLSEKTRVIVLTCPPVDEEMITKTFR